MGLFDGFTQGFYGSVDAQRAENERKDKEQRDHERSILTTLVNSPDVTDKVREYALTGLLDSAMPGKKKKGLRGFMGEMEDSPVLPHVQEFLRTMGPAGGAAAGNGDAAGGAAATTAQGLPSAHLTPEAMQAASTSTPAAPAPSSSGGAALPASSPVTGGRMAAATAAPVPTASPAGRPGAPPPSTGPALGTGPAAAPPTAMAGGGMPVAPPPVVPAVGRGAGPASVAAFGAQQAAAPPPPSGVMQPYQPQGRVFKTSEDLAVEKARGLNRGDVEGMKAGLEATGLFTPEEQAAIIKTHLARQYRGVGAQPYGSIPGEAPDETGNMVPTFAIFDKTAGKYVDPDTHQAVAGFRPRTSTGSQSLGRLYEQAARFYGFANGSAVRTPGDVERVQAKAMELQQADTYAAGTGRGNAASDVPLSTEQRFQATSNLQQEWQKVAAPVREMRRTLSEMRAGLQATQHGELNAGGMTVLTAFQKMLDPQSVVRESEYARSASGLSLMDRLYGFMEKLKNGGTGVPYEQLKQYVDLAGELEAGATASIAGERDRITAEASSWGLDATQVLGQDAPTGLAPAPQVGNPGPAPAIAPKPGASAATPAARPGAPPPSAGPGGWTMRNGQLYKPDGTPF